MVSGAAEHTPEADQWTWDKLLELAPAAQKAGLPFALGLGQTTDSVDFVGALFRSYGAELVNGKGEITVKSDAVRMALEYMVKLAKFLPGDVYSYDDASNNRALISGKSALIFNPPSAWAVAKRDNPTVAADCWTFPSPAGPKGRFVPYLPYFWGIWSFAKNKSAAKELLAYLCQREQVETLSTAVSGYDIPPFLAMSDFKIWSEVEPPLGTVLQLPDPPVARGHALHRRIPRATRHRGADLQPRDHDDDGGEDHARRPVDERRAGLGTGRTGRLHALAGQTPKGGAAMPDVAIPSPLAFPVRRSTGRLRRWSRRRSTVAFFMCLPLILLIGALVVYPAIYAIYLAMLNKRMTQFVGFGNFAFLLRRSTFHLVIFQSCLFAVSAVVAKATLGFLLAHLLHNIPAIASASGAACC